MLEKDLSALKKKVQKEHPVFTDSVDGLPLKELKESVLIYSKYQHETDMALKNDEQIERVAQSLNELKAPYRDALKALKMKIQYLHLLMQDKEIEDVKKEE
jgi:hypothetical protein